MSKRILALLLVLAMTAGMLPTVALAQETENQTLQAVYASSITANNDLSEIEWTATGAISPAAAGDPSAAISAAWDKNNLYLGIDTKNTDTVSVSLNGKTYTPALTNGVAEIAMPWSELNCSLADMNACIENLSVALNGAEKNAAATFDVHLSAMQANDIALNTIRIGGACQRGQDGNSVIFNPATTTGAQQNYALETDAEDVQIIDHSKDMLLTQTLTFESMPAGDGSINHNWLTVNKDGYLFWMLNESSTGVGLVCTIHRENGTNELYLRVHKTGTCNAQNCQSISLGKKLGETFELATLWRKNGSAAIYVDGVVVDYNTDVSITNLKNSKSYKFVYYNLANQVAHICVSDAVLTVGDTSAESLLTQDAVLGNTNLENLKANLRLPSSFGPYALTWISSDQSVITNGGVINRGDTDKEATLSVYVGTEKLWNVDVTVAAKAPLVAEELPAVWASAINTEDNILSEIEWIAMGTVDGAFSGSVSAAWDTEALYLGIDTETATEGTVTYGTFTQDFIANNGKAEINLPWTALGVAVKDLYQLVEGVMLKLNDAEGNISEGLFNVKLTSMCANDLPFDQMDLRANSNANTCTADSVQWDITKKGSIQIFTKGKPEALDNQLIDHSKDILLTQTLTFDEMPYSDGYYPAYWTFPQNCYFGWVVDTKDTANGSGILYTIYRNQTDDTLYIRIHEQGKFGAADREGISLGKKLKEVFTLSILWRADNSLAVFVDGQCIKEIDNATLVMTHAYEEKDCRFCYDNSEGNTAKLTISNAVFTVSGARSVMDSITPEKLLTGTDLSNVTADLTLPTSATTVLGTNVNLKWDSSNETVLSNNGEVTQGKEDQQVTLSLYNADTSELIGEVQVIVAGLSVKVEAIGAETVTMDNVMDEMFWFDSTPIASAKEGAPTGSVSIAYNRNGIYLGLKSVGAVKLTAELGEHTITKQLQGTGTDELELTWADLGGVVLDDYGQIIKGLKLTLESADGKTSAIKCDVTLTSKRVSKVSLNNFAKTGNTGDVSASADMAIFKTFSSGITRLYITNYAAVDHTKDIVFSQDLCIKNLPVSDGAFVKLGEAKDCYYFWLCYGTDTSTGPTTQATVYRADDEGNLYLRNYGAGDNFSLGKKLGDTFRLTMIWKAGTAEQEYYDGAVEYYVDGVLVGRSDDATITGSGMGIRAVHLAYNNYTAPVAAELTVSNVNLIAGTVESVLDEIDQGDVISGVNLKEVQGNIALAQSFESPYMGSIPLTWTSTNQAVDATGKVTIPEENSITGTLTVSARGKTLHTIDVTVVPTPKETTDAVAASPKVVTTAFSKQPIHVDGVLNEEGWVLSTRILNNENKIVGKFGVQWQNGKLYFAVKTGNAETLTLTLGDQVITVDLNNPVPGGIISEITKNGAYLEMAISYATPNQYNETVAIQVELDNGTYAGELKLASVDWFVADNETRPLPANTKGSLVLGKDAPTSGQGYMQITGGWQLYDRFVEGSNPVRVRTYAIFMNDPVYKPMSDRSRTIYTEFDFLAKAMPEYTVAEATGWANRQDQYASYGMAWFLADAADSSSYSNSVSLGIFNSADGLMLAVLPLDGTTKVVKLNKSVGDLFRVATAWKSDGSLVIYIDGEQVAAFEKVESRRQWFGDKTIAFNLIRNTTAAESAADDMVVEITNLASGHSYDDSLLDGLNWDVIRKGNLSQNQVVGDLYLPDQLSNEQLTTPQNITWTSDNAAITPDGKVTRPETGYVTVKLTATLGDISKDFILRVMGECVDNGNVLVASRDYNPAKGVGIATEETEFTLDSNNSSVIINLGSSSAVNYVKLTDSDNFARLNEEVLTLWVSNDNETYTEIKDFKLKHVGQNWYLYDFQKNAQYVKVHCTHFDGKEADFIAPVATIITAGMDDSLVVPDQGGQTVTVDSTTLYDQTVELTGVANTDKLRISMDGELLYHYVENGKVFVRIPKPGSNIKLTLWNGSESDLELSNKEYVYEITYGTRETRPIAGEAHWLFTVPGTNGQTILSIREAGNRLYTVFSYDGGRTWSTTQTNITCANGKISEGGGFIYNSVDNVIMFQGHYARVNATQAQGDFSKVDCKTYVISSKDGGKTWGDPVLVDTGYGYSLSYTDGIQLSCYDGEGPNVDFVFPIGCLMDLSGTLGAKVVYTTDAGKTWQTGDDLIRFDAGAAGHESGVSECTVQERADGVLVLLGRNQGEGMNNFAQAYSYDQGKTWTKAKLSTVYTVNTQPIMYRYDNATLLTWGGNNIMGGDSYIRTPYSIGVTYDGMENFRNIQDLYVKYSLQGLTFAKMNRITNQSVQKAGADDLITSWWNHTENMAVGNTLMMRVSDFTDYLYRTKGAYDSFEHGTVKYEGWDATSGDVTLSGNVHSDGQYSMKLSNGVVARSIPYLQNGAVSMDIWADDAAFFTVELQSTYTNVYGKGAPVGFRVDGNQLTMLGSTANALTLDSGKNTITIQLNLDAKNPSATLQLNDAETIEMPVNTAIGDYVCFITIADIGTVYVDNVLVIDEQDAIVPDPTVEKMVVDIANIGAVTLKSEQKITKIRGEYNDLSVEQKAKVTNLSALEAAEAKLAALKEGSIGSLEASVSLKDEVCYNFYFKLSEELSGADITEMGLLMWESDPADPTYGKSDKIYPGAVACTGADAGKFKVTTDGVAAKNMGDTRYFRIFAMKSDGTYAYSKLFQYSAKTYAMNQIQANRDADLTKLCIALLNYGAEAQKYFKSKGDYDYTELMNAALTDEQKQIGYDAGMVAKPVQADESKVGDFVATADGFGERNVSVSLGGALSINYYFTAANATTDMKLYVWDSETYESVGTLTAENAEVIPMNHVSGNKFKGTVAGIVARQFDKTVYVCGEYEFGGTTYRTGVIACSFGKYCTDKAAQAVAEKNVAMAAAVYGYYAKQYLN